MKKVRAFTLIELLVVISVIAILATIGSVVFTGIQKNTGNAKRKEDVNAIAKAFEARFNPSSGLYQDVTGTDFAGGAIPNSPESGNYNRILSSGNAGFRVCAVLEQPNPPASCSESSETCFCKDSAQGTYAAPSGSPTPTPTPISCPDSVWQ